MSAKCAICKKAIVSQKGQVCITCQMNQRTSNPMPTVEAQPVFQSNSINVNTGVLDNTISKGTVKSTGSYQGTVHNYHQTEVRRSIFWKLWNSCIRGVPFSTSNTQYEFTLYEEGNVGVLGHEVVLYGDAGYSLLSDNSEVIVRGKLDRNGVIVASEVTGVNTGFHMRPRNGVPAAAIRIMLVLLVGVIIAGAVLGRKTVEGVTSGIPSCDVSVGRILLFIIAVLAAIVILKSRIRKKYLYVMLPILFALGLYNSVCLALFAVLLVCIIFIRKKK